MQRDLRGLDSELANPGQDFRSKVQTRRRCRDRTAFSRVHGLVELPIRGPVLTVDIRRQRHMPKPVQYRKKIRHRLKADPALPELAPFHNLRLQFLGLAEIKLLSYPN